jgi:hypothetical protein
MSIPNTTHRILVERLGGTDATTFIGNEGEVFYDPNNPVLKLSNGLTPGGLSVGITTITGEIVEGGSGAGTPISLTNQYALLHSAIGTNNKFTLANGQEGQVLYIVPGDISGNSYVENIVVNVSRLRHRDPLTQNTTVSLLADVNVFVGVGATSDCTMVTAIFADNAWNLSNGFVIL